MSAIHDASIPSAPSLGASVYGWIGRLFHVLASLQAVYERKRHFQALSVDGLMDIGLHDPLARHRLARRPFWEF